MHKRYAINLRQIWRQAAVSCFRTYCFSFNIIKTAQNDIENQRCGQPAGKKRAVT